MKFKKLMRKIHKWLGLIIGLQVFFWVVGGLVMSSFPIERVHGDHLRKESLAEPLQMQSLLPIADVVKSSGLAVIEIATKPGFAGPQYHLMDSDRKLHFYNAVTGKRMPAVNEIQAVMIAKSLYTGSAEIINTQRINENSTEYRKRIPAWRIEFNDSESSTLYIAADNGDLMSVRNSMWRIFDFVWMLHIMDYQERDDFNNWLLILAAALAVVFAISGIYLVLKTFRRKDFGLKN